VATRAAILTLSDLEIVEAELREREDWQAQRFSEDRKARRIIVMRCASQALAVVSLLGAERESQVLS
jgi:hypothetical protein